jgi:hypothetical protein
VPESLAAQNVTCPSCKVDFFATPPETPTPLEALSQAPAFKPPAKLPFFKSGKIAMLEERLQELFSIHGGVVADDTRQELQRDAIVLGLPENAANELLREHFMHELAPIKERMQSLSTMTDHDYDDIEQLEQKYNQESYDFQELRKQYNGDLVLALREKDSLAILKTDALTFLPVNKIESTGYLPPPIKSDLMLNNEEVAYRATPSVWSQSRVHSYGYAGPSISLPTGIKHVRFRFGGYSPIKSEEITPLSSGTLYVTSARLLFNGDSKNTTVTLKKIVDGHIFADCLRVEKSTGKPDYFSMQPLEARCILALIGALK